MKLEPELEKWFEEAKTMPTFIVTADIGCDSHIIIPAVNEDGSKGLEKLFLHLDAVWYNLGFEELVEYLGMESFEIKVGPEMSKEEWEGLSEFEGC